MQNRSKRWLNNNAFSVNAVAAIAIGAMLIFSVSGFKAFADVLQADALDSSTLSVSVEKGETTDVQYWLVGNGPDGCNVDSTHKATVTLTVPSGVSASKSSFDLDKCKDGSNNNAATITFTGVTEGGPYTVNVASVSGGKSGNNGYNDGPADGLKITVTSPPPPADTTAPTVDSTDPDDDATGVAIDSDVSATFSEKIKASTLSTSTFTVGEGDDNIGGSVSLSSDGLTATFTPAVDLAYSTTYTATIKSTVTDEAGNQLGTDYTWTFTTEAAPDSIAPTTTSTLDPSSPNGQNGWYVSSPVTVTLSAEDNAGGSGVKSTTYEIDGGSAQTYSGPFTVSGDGSHTITFRSEDNNGNVETDQSVSVQIDQTKPTITGSATPAANADGWNNEDVTVAFDCQDATSDIASCEGGTTLTTETDTTGTTVTGTATDKAGNTATTNVGPIKIDKTKPTNIQFTGGQITDGSTYYFGFVPSPPTGCTAEDVLSGLDNCSVDSTNGGSAIGTHSYVANAVDNADNSDSKTLAYTVNPWTLSGYKSPVTMSPNAPTEIVWNTLKGGQTAPLKFEIFAGSTEITSTTVNNSPVGTFKTQKISCTTDPTPVEDPLDLTTTGGTTFRFDSTSGQFVQNWQTAKAPNTCYTATFTAQDGSSLTAYFKLK
jgi:hypothetical protein